MKIDPIDNRLHDNVNRKEFSIDSHLQLLKQCKQLSIKELFMLQKDIMFMIQYKLICKDKLLDKK